MYIVKLPVNVEQLATKKAQRKDARQHIQTKGLVVVSDDMVWVNQSVEETMEPYSDAED
jgi:hypothetical protein